MGPSRNLVVPYRIVVDPPWVRFGPTLEPDWLLSRFILVLEWAQLGLIVELYWFLLGSYVDQRWNSLMGQPWTQLGTLMVSLGSILEP